MLQAFRCGWWDGWNRWFGEAEECLGEGFLGWGKAGGAKLWIPTMMMKLLSQAQRRSEWQAGLTQRQGLSAWTSSSTIGNFKCDEGCNTFSEAIDCLKQWLEPIHSCNSTLCTGSGSVSTCSSQASHGPLNRMPWSPLKQLTNKSTYWKGSETVVEKCRRRRNQKSRQGILSRRSDSLAKW